MADETDVLLKLCEEQWAQARQSEEQRSTMTNIILVITSATLGFISQKGLVQDVLPLTIFLIVAGLYGAVTAEKLYERFNYHYMRAWHWRKRIEQLLPKTQITKSKEQADADHKKEFPRMTRVRLHYLWLILHISISILGIVLTFLIIV